jgi:hypothetical protein
MKQSSIEIANNFMTVGKRDLKVMVMSVEIKRLLSKEKGGLIRRDIRDIRDIQDRMKILYRYSSWESIKNCLLTDTLLGRGPV